MYPHLDVRLCCDRLTLVSFNRGLIFPFYPCMQLRDDVRQYPCCAFHDRPVVTVPSLVYTGWSYAVFGVGPWWWCILVQLVFARASHYPYVDAALSILSGVCHFSIVALGSIASVCLALLYHICMHPHTTVLLFHDFRTCHIKQTYQYYVHSTHIYQVTSQNLFVLFLSFVFNFTTICLCLHSFLVNVSVSGKT